MSLLIELDAFFNPDPKLGKNVTRQSRAGDTTLVGVLVSWIRRLVRWPRCDPKSK
jgi:hypothetical protein